MVAAETADGKVIFVSLRRVFDGPLKYMKVVCGSINIGYRTTAQIYAESACGLTWSLILQIVVGQLIFQGCHVEKLKRLSRATATFTHNCVKREFNVVIITRVSSVRACYWKIKFKN